MHEAEYSGDTGRERRLRAARNSRTLVERRPGPRRPKRANLSAALSRLDREHAGLLLAIAELESQERSSHPDGYRQALMPLLREELAQTQRALERAAQGQYGTCEICHRELTMRLLDLSPSTTICPVCEARAQRESAISRA